MPINFISKIIIYYLFRTQFGPALKISCTQSDRVVFCYFLSARNSVVADLLHDTTKTNCKLQTQQLVVCICDIMHILLVKL